MRYLPTYRLLLFSLLCVTVTLHVQADVDHNEVDLKQLSQDLDFTVEPDFSDELDGMIDQFNDELFLLKEPSRITVFLRSVADPVVYYAMKFYQHTLEGIRKTRVKILAMLGRNNRSFHNLN